MKTAPPESDGSSQPPQYPGFDKQVYGKLLTVGSCRLTLWDGSGQHDSEEINGHIARTSALKIGAQDLLIMPVRHIIEPALNNEQDDPKKFQVVKNYFSAENCAYKLLLLYGGDFNRRSGRNLDLERIKFLSRIVAAGGKKGMILVTGTDPYGGRRSMVPNANCPDQVFYASLGTGRSPIVSKNKHVSVPKIPAHNAWTPSIFSQRSKPPIDDNPEDKTGLVQPLGHIRIGFDEPKPPSENDS